jgi:hypothetical protein
MSINDRTITFCIKELMEAHRCHTIILYGSMATGDFNEKSDFDMAGFRKGGERTRVARMEGGAWLDLFVFPDELLRKPAAEHMYMKDGIVLVEKENEGTNFLEALQKLHARGPDMLPACEKEARRHWAFKMLERAERGDVEGLYRLSWLLFSSLEDFFALRDRWYPGSKKAFASLEKEKPELYTLFAGALEKPRDLPAVRRLMEAVYGPEEGGAESCSREPRMQSAESDRGKTVVETDLDELAAAFDDSSYEHRYYLDVQTGEVLFFSDYCDENADLEQEISEDESGRYVALETESSEEGFGDMAAFIEVIAPGSLRDRLCSALERKKPFRHFKDILESCPGERERWFHFKDERLRERVLQWARQQGLELRDTKGREG